MKRVEAILSEELLKRGLIAQNQLDALLKDLSFSGEGLQQALVKRGLISEKDIVSVLGETLGIKVIDLKSVGVEKQVLEKIPVKIATYYKFMPVALKDRILTVATSTPMDVKTQDEIRTQLGYDIELNLATSEDIAETLGELAV